MLNVSGITIYKYYTRGNMEISFDDVIIVEFAGSLLALLSYVSEQVSSGRFRQACNWIWSYMRHTLDEGRACRFTPVIYKYPFL